ncbi:MAG: SGNH/GDSL hydrolase family protein [Lachnospiraceae bacterium]|nr:SGNH/GDSL hydrolase family protein [Lachnospiraceae bacterium]
MKTRYKILLMSLLFGLCTAMIGCSSEENNSEPVIPTATPTVAPLNTATPTVKPTNTPRPTNTPKPTNTPTPTFIPEPDPDGEFFNASSALDKKLGAYYAGVLTDAEVSKGNAYRLSKKLDAAKEGAETTVLFLGGSVTEGSNASERTPKGYQKGYAYITFEYLRDTYGFGDGSNFKYVNAGISGTSSALGMNRVEDDVLSFKPDIIFIEFAVNNDSRITYDNKTYESLIRRCLNAEGEPAVVLLFSAATYAGGTQAVMEKIGAFYDLTMISMHNALKTPQNKKAIEWSDFSKDSVHPQQAGHYLYAKAICKTLKHAYEENTSKSYNIPENVSKEGYGDYENLHMINNTNAEGYITDLGCFQTSKTNHATSGNSDSFALEKGWIKRSDAEDKPMVITLECKSFHVVVKQVNAKTDVDFDVYVDGVKTSTITTSKSGAWNNAFAYVVFESDECSEHTIEIKANESSVAANATILSLGYCK